MKPLKQTLMERDGITEEEAQQQIDECKAELMSRIDEGLPYDECCDICEEFFGLEPDYLEDLIV